MRVRIRLGVKNTRPVLGHPSPLGISRMRPWLVHGNRFILGSYMTYAYSLLPGNRFSRQVHRKRRWLHFLQRVAAMSRDMVAFEYYSINI